jgi:2-oxoglutarate dehydrogenase E1 component
VRGKVYYDLIKHREAAGRTDVAIVRLEQYYPLPESELRDALSAYPAQTPVTWVQEEPENQGAWRFLFTRWGGSVVGRPLSSVCRPEAASPATGSENAHKMEQTALIEEAFGAAPSPRTRRRPARLAG